jgi:hypothetical protein
LNKICSENSKNTKCQYKNKYYFDSNFRHII